MDYQQAWDLQRRLADERISGTRGDTLVLVEHPPVYTAGRRTQPMDLPVDGTPVVEVDRGGRITWHGPGQLVAYPIVKLAEAMHVVAYVRLLEQALIGTCADFGVQTLRVAGRSGVWLPAEIGRQERKVAAIGVRVAKGVTTHGLALNCNPDLTAFDRIVPCGITDAGVTSLTAELAPSGKPEVTVARALPVLSRWLLAALNGEVPVASSTRAGAQDAGIGSASADNGVDWHLAPAVRGG